MSKILFMLLFCLVPFAVESRRVVSGISARCPYPRIAHGYARLRQRGRVVRFVCDSQFELVGNRYSTCNGGKWDEPMPICVSPSPNCEEPTIEHGVTVPSQNNAWLLFFCLPGHRLVGSTALYCDGNSWNGTAPNCVPETTEVQLSCDFESSTLCGWRQDDTHDFDWRRHNYKTPSAFAFTGPSFDHTFGVGKAGYYMYIESSSRITNDTARLLSPVFDGSLTKDGCFSFFYHMYGKSIGGLRVYQVPENSQQIVNLSEEEKKEHLLFEKWGNLGDFWYRNVSKLTETNSNFQIVIEGIRGPSFTSDIAIDDVALLQGEQCNEATATAVTPPDMKSESCSNRCDISGSRTPERGCGCTFACVSDGDCCPDFFEMCIFIASPSGSDDDDDSTNLSNLPRTEKLIGSTTTPTPTTTSTTPTPTKTTPTSTKTTPITTKTTPTPTTSTTTQRTTKIKPPLFTRPTNTLKPTVATTRATLPTTVKITTTQNPWISTTPEPKKLTTKPTTVVTRTTMKLVLKNSTKVDAEKAKKEQAIEAKKVVQGKPEPPSSSTAAIVCTLLVVTCGACATLVALRSARGRAALARLRARAHHDTEVQYLTRDCD